MAWTVNVYYEVVQGRTILDVEDELIALENDAATSSDAIRILAWLRDLPVGVGDPRPEPEIIADSRLLKYRTVASVVVIFWLDRAQRQVDVLRFAAAASGYPTVSDLSLAETRLKKWRG